MVFNSPVNDELWLVHGPLPLGPDGIGVMPPAENTLVGASQTRRSLHATVGLDSVEGVLKICSDSFIQATFDGDNLSGP